MRRGRLQIRPNSFKVIGVLLIAILSLMNLRAAVFTVALLAIPSFLSGQLSFETTEIHVDVEYGAERVERDFAFENTGTYAVTIREIRSSCGCTTADLEKRTYEPGEGGKITGIFTVGNRVGERVNTISLETDDPANPSYNLRMVVDIPRALTLSPRFLSWRRDGDAETQTVDVAFHPDSPFELEEVEVESENFEVRVIADEENENRYRLEITPLNISEPERTVIFLKTSPEVSNPRAFSLYAYIR